tara:strand:- start:440 stop:655 length:216 start_codon:yes stop_codon:yes gene_type:complete
MWEITIAILVFIYAISVVLFIYELTRESSEWEETKWFRIAILFYMLISVIPLFNTVIAFKAYKYRKKEEKS